MSTEQVLGAPKTLGLGKAWRRLVDLPQEALKERQSSRLGMGAAIDLPM